MGPKSCREPPLYDANAPLVRCPFAHSQLIDLCRQHEIAFGKSVNLMGPDRNLGLTPAKTNVRMVALCLGKFTDTIDERERLAKVLESICLQQVMLVHGLPISQLTKQ